MIAALYNVPQDRNTLSRFAFHNRDAHELAVQRIFLTTGVKLPLYPIDPILMEDFRSWAYTHQAMHNAVNLALKLQGNDLTDVDPRETAQLVTWVQLHAAEHIAWGNILRYG